MKQLLQDLKTGNTYLAEAAMPSPAPREVLIRSECSLISLGTERMLVEFGKANWIGKALKQPEKVKQVLAKVRYDGLSSAMRAVDTRLSKPIALGYANAGTVVSVGHEVSEFSAGDRVASNGSHAEFVSVPQNMVARLPDEVSFNNGCFTSLGAIALQSIRLANPTLGETVVIIGLGLVGQLAAQISHANGCNVLGFDLDNRKVKLSRACGISAYDISETVDPVKTAVEQTSGRGVDIVIIAAATNSNELIADAANMCRKRGRIILVGVTGLKINRSDFYEKELSFQVSCSYGPGRHDPQYEEKGHDYPFGLVRWTIKRNFEAFLRLIEDGRISVKPLISDVVPFSKAEDKYSSLQNSTCIATILEYDSNVNSSRDTTISIPASRKLITYDKSPVFAIAGSGLYAKGTILPELLKLGAQIKYICSKGGLSAADLSRKYSIPYATTDYQLILEDPDVSAVIIATRHDTHADLAKKALHAGKHVFVEKPLCINKSDLEEIISIKLRPEFSQLSLTVGFNRRFSRLTEKAKQLLGNPAPVMNIEITVNADFIAETHWTQDPELGGGRIIGEACHFIDLFSAIAQSPIIAVCCSHMGIESNSLSDNVSILLKSQNGTQGVVNYFSNGAKSFPKEQIKIFASSKILCIDNFRQLSGFGVRNFKRIKLKKQDKGHQNQFELLLHKLNKEENDLIPFDEIINSTMATFAAVDSLSSATWIRL